MSPCHHLSRLPAQLTLTSRLFNSNIPLIPPPQTLAAQDRSPDRFQTALVGSFGALIALYAAFATVAYLHFGPHVSDNVLRDLGDSFWGNSARAAMARDPSSDVTLPTL